jgi:hypothetical protein
MNHSRGQYRQGTTSIEDVLYDVELEDPRGSMQQNSAIRPEQPSTDKYIRNQYETPSASGMVSVPDQVRGPPPPMNMVSGSPQERDEERPYIKQSLADRVDAGHSPSCLRIADHVLECQMCSRFYNPDRTLYIIVIVVLTLICILLLKRVLDI